MIQVKISQDINKYQNRTLWGFSPRQVLYSVAAVGLGLLINFKLTFIPQDIRGFLVMFEAAPLVGCGWIKIQGMTLEKYAMVFIKSNLINKERLFVNENLKDCLPETNKRKKEKH